MLCDHRLHVKLNVQVVKKMLLIGKIFIYKHSCHLDTFYTCIKNVKKRILCFTNQKFFSWHINNITNILAIINCNLLSCRQKQAKNLFPSRLSCHFCKRSNCPLIDLFWSQMIAFSWNICTVTLCSNIQLFNDFFYRQEQN